MGSWLLLSGGRLQAFSIMPLRSQSLCQPYQPWMSWEEVFPGLGALPDQQQVVSNSFFCTPEILVSLASLVIPSLGCLLLPSLLIWLLLSRLPDVLHRWYLFEEAPWNNPCCWLVDGHHSKNTHAPNVLRCILGTKDFHQQRLQGPRYLELHAHSLVYKIGLPLGISLCMGHWVLGSEIFPSWQSYSSFSLDFLWYHP